MKLKTVNRIIRWSGFTLVVTFDARPDDVREPTLLELVWLGWRSDAWDRYLARCEREHQQRLAAWEAERGVAGLAGPAWEEPGRRLRSGRVAHAVEASGSTCSRSPEASFGSGAGPRKFARASCHTLAGTPASRPRSRRAAC